VNTDEEEAFARSGQTLIDKNPGKPDTWLLVCGLLLLCVTNTKKPDWSDGICVVMALVNVVYFTYRFLRHRTWERQRDAWLQQLQRTRQEKR